mmetsp:Transcript_58861/g.133256  ORF Transcript_58861/g.133256 Transcript_58861/m.133256 type:complete len:200 (+) Transcript_58861:844-1443(+)
MFFSDTTQSTPLASLVLLDTLPFAAEKIGRTLARKGGRLLGIDAVLLAPGTRITCSGLRGGERSSSAGTILPINSLRYSLMKVCAIISCDEDKSAASKSSLNSRLFEAGFVLLALFEPSPTAAGSSTFTGPSSPSASVRLFLFLFLFFLLLFGSSIGFSSAEDVESRRSFSKSKSKPSLPRSSPISLTVSFEPLIKEVV